MTMKVGQLVIILSALAVIAGAAAAVKVYGSREAAARALADASEADAEAAAAEKKALQAERDAASENRRAKEAEQAANEAALEAEKLARARAADEKATAEANAKAAADAKATAAAKAAEAEATLRTARAKAAAEEAAKAAAAANEKAEAAKAAAAADERERTKIAAEQVVAEAKVAELKRQNLDELIAVVLARKAEYEQRLAELQPDMSIADLLGEEDVDHVIDEDGNLQEVEKKPYREEDDRKLSPKTRELAKTVREVGEDVESRRLMMRANAVAALEKLYTQAVAFDRQLDAEYYRKAICSLYPDWNPPKQADGKEKEEKEEDGK